MSVPSFRGNTSVNRLDLQMQTKSMYTVNKPAISSSLFCMKKILMLLEDTSNYLLSCLFSAQNLEES